MEQKEEQSRQRVYRKKQNRLRRREMDERILEIEKWHRQKGYSRKELEERGGKGWENAQELLRHF